MGKIDFFDFSKEEFEIYIKDLHPEIWMESFQRALIAKKDNDLIKLFHYSFPNELCDEVQKEFFEQYDENIVKEIFAYTNLPEYFGKAVLTKEEFAKLDLRIFEEEQKVICLKIRNIKLVICFYSIKNGGFSRIREENPEIADKLYKGRSNPRFLYAIDFGGGYACSVY